eukprot:sb/3465229/
MPRLAPASLHEYKSRICDLEGEVNTLKRRLDELRRAKIKATVKPPPLKPLIPETVHPDRTEEIRVLNQRITRLSNELELSELRYARDTQELRATIKRLKEEIEEMKSEREEEVKGIRVEQKTEIAILKRRHMEELAAYTESSERDKKARIEAEQELCAYKTKMRSQPNVELLRSELLKLQSAYQQIKLDRDRDVGMLEERIEELVAEITALNEKPRRKYQLIPDRTYIVKQASPTASSTSCCSIEPTPPQNGSNGSNSNNNGTNSNTVVRSNQNINSAVRSNNSTAVRSNSTSTPAPPLTSHHIPTSCRPKQPPVPLRSQSSDPRPTSAAARPKSTPAARAKSSCGPRKTPVRPPDRQVPLTRPKSCWGERRLSNGAGVSTLTTQTVSFPRQTNTRTSSGGPWMVGKK